MTVSALAMILLLTAALGGFAWTARHRMRLLLIGGPANRFDHLFDRMATPPGRLEPDFLGIVLVSSIFVLPVAAAGVGIAAFLTTPDFSSDYGRFLALLLAAGAGGQALLWSMRAQIKMPKYADAGIAHYLIFTGFAVLLLRTLVLVGRAFDPHFNLWLLDPASPLPWGLLGKGYNLMKDAVVAGVLLGVTAFLRFRLLNKLKRLAYGWHAWVVLGVISTMMLAEMVYGSGALAREAVRYASEHNIPVAEAADHLGFEECSPLGWLGARALLGMGLTSEGALGVLATVGYWIHVSLVWGFLNYLPYGKHFHVIVGLPNVLFRNMEKPGRLEPMAATSDELMEKVAAAAELPHPTDAPVGVAQIGQLSWKSLLDLYTCTECGRCSDNCPAHRTGKLLSPKQFTIDLRDHLYARRDELIASGGKPPAVKEGDDAAAERKSGTPGQLVDLVPGVIDPDVLWGCTTCRACEEQCPVMISYVDKIVDMRRNLVLVKGEFPHELQKTFSALETNGNPWNLTRMDRGEWSDGLGIATMAEKPDADVLYWVGCAGSYDDSAKKIARATAKIFTAAGVNFAILGSEETCTGDPARRAGNEYLYMMLAEQNVATLNQYKPKKIVTTCPHCFNTLLNEYPDLGAKYEVVHHSDFLLGLLAEGKIVPKRGVRARVAYHDSCYLGRYNEVYESPREVLKRIPGVELVEAEWSREKGLCCGAGGAQMWMEEQNNDRVNKRRTLQLLATKPDVIASGCPFCHTMLTDGVKALAGDEEVMPRPVEQLDLAVLLERSLDLDAHSKKADSAEQGAEA